MSSTTFVIVTSTFDVFVICTENCTGPPGSLTDVGFADFWTSIEPLPTVCCAFVKTHLTVSPASSSKTRCPLAEVAARLLVVALDRRQEPTCVAALGRDVRARLEVRDDDLAAVADRAGGVTAEREAALRSVGARLLLDDDRAELGQLRVREGARDRLACLQIDRVRLALVVAGRGGQLPAFRRVLGDGVGAGLELVDDLLLAVGEIEGAVPERERGGSRVSPLGV